MRKLVVAAVLLTATAVKAQKGVPFKLKFLPKHTYTVTGNTDIISKVTSVGQADASSKTPKKRSMENKGNFVMSYVIKTGATGAGGSFPYTLTVTNFSSKNIVNGVEDKGAPKNPIVGATSTGQFTADGKMQTEKLSFLTGDSKTKKAVLNMVNKLADEIQFPTKPMKVGESFTQVKPFSVANGGSNIGIKTTIVYTLKAVKGNLAYFDTKEKISMDIDEQKNNRKATVKTTGNGAGTMVYDIDNNFALAKADKFDTKMDLQMGTTSMAVDANSNISYKAKISAN